MTKQELLRNYNNRKIVNRVHTVLLESKMSKYDNTYWTYSSIRNEIDRIMDAHTESKLTLAYLTSLKMSVHKQLDKTTDKYMKKALQGGITDIINCSASINSYLRDKNKRSTYVTNNRK